MLQVARVVPNDKVNVNVTVNTTFWIETILDVMFWIDTIIAFVLIIMIYNISNNRRDAQFVSICIIISACVITSSACISIQSAIFHRLSTNSIPMVANFFNTASIYITCTNLLIGVYMSNISYPILQSEGNSNTAMSCVLSAFLVFIIPVVENCYIIFDFPVIRNDPKHIFGSILLQIARTLMTIGVTSDLYSLAT
jgi:hypothetical protein